MTQHAQVIVITGCSTGIGLALAVMLAKDQQKRYKVYATMRNLSKRKALDEATPGELDSTLFVRELDVTKDDSVNTFFTNLLKETGRIDVLVNNAGIALCAAFEYIPIETIRHVLETNFYGPVRTIRGVLPKMKEQRSGKIINISSLLGVFGAPFTETYAASKFALEGMSECLVSTLRKFNIYVSTVQFGHVQTDAIKNMELLHKDIDVSKADETTLKLIKANDRARQKTMTGNMCQTADEAAKFIIGIIQEDTPKFRYQPSKGSHDMVATKLKDASGEEQVHSAIQTYFRAARVSSFALSKL
ncbi:retinol dehydrogenase 8-like [Ptychodera flava]|uniref:retinol dehydrogenase 8-like n=1 Tax=Ptychodera flava TaxID=63121 RepID=UPI00396A4D08